MLWCWLFKVWEDRSVPLSPAFEGRCWPEQSRSDVPVSELPHKDGELVRPAAVWWDEDIDPRLMDKSMSILNGCDLLLVRSMGQH